MRKRRVNKGMGTIVDDIMTRAPVTIGGADTLEGAVPRMDTNNVKWLVVTDDHHRVGGIAACADLVKLFAVK